MRQSLVIIIVFAVVLVLSEPSLSRTDFQIGNQVQVDAFLGRELEWWFPMNEGAGHRIVNVCNPEASGNLLNSSMNHSTSGWVLDDRGWCIQFDGIDDVMHLAQYGGKNYEGGKLFSDSFTISVWVKPNDGQPAGLQYFFGDVDTSDNFRVVCFRWATGVIGFWYQVSGVLCQATSAAAEFQNGQEDWHLLTCVADANIKAAGGLKMYLDGKAVVLGASNGNTSAVDFADFSINRVLSLAARTHSPSYYAQVRMKDFRAYSKAFTEWEVKELYRKTKDKFSLPVATPDLLLYKPGVIARTALDEWQLIDDTIDTVVEGSIIDLSNSLNSVISVSLIAVEATIYNGMKIAIQVSSNSSGDEDWTVLKEFYSRAPNPVGVDLNAFNGNQSAGETVLETISTVGRWDDDETRWIGLYNALLGGDIVDSEISLLVSHVTNTSITVLDPTTHGHLVTDGISDVANTYNVLIPLEYQRARIIYDQTYPNGGPQKYYAKSDVTTFEVSELLGQVIRLVQ